ncbi:Nucleotidyl transferase [Methanolacinia petrolearia DSM 11571]|uniref:Nucleotidyl transferase n=1 Tax=Methanolacinia petrolearia (strain DSM 11571 / OCM 486 / SEBR 4847) TaxID=679926 RepID=E1REY0_METP4|nr:nucleotidyltransferase family protein [Methanolacinia petrolearia]ADN36151.1 Nucleotidyl transferase [Methanolacinia petrolearia DSM 11571]
MIANPENIDVVILCGGLGTRLRSAVSDRPKALANFGEKTFIDILIDSILKYKFKNITLCVGYQKEQIIKHFEYEKDYNLKFSAEDIPLGTGGALKKAVPAIESDTFIVMNGDSICNPDFKQLLQFHINKKAVMTMALTHSSDKTDYGNVTMDQSQIITNFEEKINSNEESFINAGIYVMQKEIFSYMPKEEIFSLEYDLFPKLVNKRCYGYIIKNELIDIGTPERYNKAVSIIGDKK